MASHWSFEHMQPKLWEKEGSGVKLAIWLPTTKSRESTSSRHPIRKYDMALEKSRRGLQLWLRPRCDRTLQSIVMAVQNFRSPTGTISGLHFGSPKKLCHWDVASIVSCKEYYMGEGGGFLESGSWWVLCVQVPVACPNTQRCPKCQTNLLWLVFGCRFTQAKLVPLPNLIPRLPTRPSTPF
jgi:hypothetical protein